MSNVVTEKPASRFTMPTERRLHPRTCIVVDAACDLPGPFIRKNEIVVLPIKVATPTGTLVDQRDTLSALAFFSDSRRLDPKYQYGVHALDDAATQTFLLKNVPATRDNLLQLTSDSKHTGVYRASTKVARAVMRLHNRTRKLTHFRTKFRFWVMDSRTLFSGQGVLAYEAVRQIKRGNPPRAVVDHLRNVRRTLFTLVVPTRAQWLASNKSDTFQFSLQWLRDRFRRTVMGTPVLHMCAGEATPVSVFPDRESAIADAIEQVRATVQRGLRVPLVLVSYAGALSEIEARDDFQLLCSLSQTKEIEILLSTMSMVGAAKMGAGTLSIAFSSSFFSA